MWTIISEAGRDSRYKRLVLARCSCGLEAVRRYDHIVSGRSAGCQGCLNRRTFVTHGQTKTPEYGVWARMRGRCHNRAAADYPRWGGRGIRVCERWRSFAAFLEDMGPRPSPQHSLDRIDNNGDYAPGNCRWATAIQQSGNRRNSILITIGGTTRCARRWASLNGLKPATVYYRLRRGWDPVEAVTRPVSPPNN